MLSARPTPHHAHKENLFPSKTPARGLAVHRDAGARTVGKQGVFGTKTPFGKAGGGGENGKGAMTTGRKGLGASLGPGRGAGQAAESNIAPMRLFQASCAKPSSSSASIPHSKSATFAPGPTTSTKPSFGDVTNGGQPSHALRTPAPPSKRAFATPAPSRATGGGPKQAVFQTPLPSATRTTRRRSSKLHTTPLAPAPQPAFSTPTDRTLPADASFELDLAPTTTAAAEALTDLLEEHAVDDEVEYMPAFSSRNYEEPPSFGYAVPDPVELGRDIRAMGVAQWDEAMAESYRAEAARSPVGWEDPRWEGDGWKAQTGWSESSEGGYDSDEDLAALLNMPLAALKSHQRASAAQPLSLASTSTATAPTRRPAGGLGASRPALSTVPRRAGAAAGPPPTASPASRQRTTTAPAPSAVGSSSSTVRRPLRPSPSASSSGPTAAPARARALPPPSSASSTLSRRPATTTTSSTPLSRAAPSPNGTRPAAAQPTQAERDLALRLKRRDEALADRAFVLAGLEGLDAGPAQDDAGFALDA